MSKKEPLDDIDIDIIDRKAIELIELMMHYIGELHSQNLALGEATNIIVSGTMAQNKELMEELDALKRNIER